MTVIIPSSSVVLYDKIHDNNNVNDCLYPSIKFFVPITRRNKQNSSKQSGNKTTSSKSLKAPIINFSPNKKKRATNLIREANRSVAYREDIHQFAKRLCIDNFNPNI